MHRFALFSYLVLCWVGCGVLWVPQRTVYVQGDHIEGERLELLPLGNFEYKRWQDHYTEGVQGSYELRPGRVLLTVAPCPDSLHVDERIQPGDSIRLRVEIWDDAFVERRSEMTNLLLELLLGDSVVAQTFSENGTAAFCPSLEFNAWRLTSNGLLLRKTYYRRHPKANLFFVRYRYGNLQTPHLLFDDMPWRRQAQSVQSRFVLQGRERKRLLKKTEDG